LGFRTIPKRHADAERDRLRVGCDQADALALAGSGIELELSEGVAVDVGSTMASCDEDADDLAPSD